MYQPPDLIKRFIFSFQRLIWHSTVLRSPYLPRSSLSLAPYMFEFGSLLRIHATTGCMFMYEGLPSSVWYMRRTSSEHFNLPPALGCTYLQHLRCDLALLKFEIRYVIAVMMRYVPVAKSPPIKGISLGACRGDSWQRIPSAIELILRTRWCQGWARAQGQLVILLRGPFPL